MAVYTIDLLCSLPTTVQPYSPQVPESLQASVSFDVPATSQETDSAANLLPVDETPRKSSQQLMASNQPLMTTDELPMPSHQTPVTSGQPSVVPAPTPFGKRESHSVGHVPLTDRHDSQQFCCDLCLVPFDRNLELAKRHTKAFHHPSISLYNVTRHPNGVSGLAKIFSLQD